MLLMRLLFLFMANPIIIGFAIIIIKLKVVTGSYKFMVCSIIM